MPCSASIPSSRDGEAIEGRVVGKVALVVADPAQELRPNLGIERDAAVLVEGPGDLGPEGLVVVRPPADRHELPVLGQEVGAPELGQRREHLAVRQVAGRPEQDHDVRVGHALEPQALAQRVDVLLRGSMSLADAVEPLLRESSGAWPPPPCWGGPRQAFLTACPPNSLRSAARTLAP